MEFKQRHNQSIHRDVMGTPGYASMDDDPLAADGDDYLELLPVGSFADESPPRRRSPQGPVGREASPSMSPRFPQPPGAADFHDGPQPPPHHPSFWAQPSPRNVYPYYHQHSSSPGGNAPQPPPHHPFSYASSYPPPRFYPYPPYPASADRWSSPPAFDDGTSFDCPPPPDSENRQGRDPPSSMETSSTTTTPEKSKTRSPFRSPPLSHTKSFRKSPMFHASPAIGMCGSFGILDTPGGNLAAEFSPMGPMGSMLVGNPFERGYDDSDPPKIGVELSLSRSNSDDDDEADELEAPKTSTKLPSQSPFSGFIRDFNHFPPPSSAQGGLKGVSRSPLRSDRRGATTSDPRADRPPISILTSTQPDERRGRPTASGIQASPLAQSSGAKPRKLWHGAHGAGDKSRPLRLELGGMSSQQKSLEGINSMMRNQIVAPMATPSNRGYPAVPPPPSAGYRDLNTPIKLGPSPVQSRQPVPKFPPSTTKKAPQVFPSATKSVTNSARKSDGKENATRTPGSKRQACNCKKSKCLKLYCECFAGELYCDGCNCGDCHNTEKFQHIREKAIKDTKAKNPNAFKPRISVKGKMATTDTSPQSGHNMGCRCKKSECLKKYCECFQAGVMCGGKCKCVDCMNFAGSQKLIDKRRKIKDTKGAELAMKVAQETWKGGAASARKTPAARPAVHGMRPIQSPIETPGAPPHSQQRFSMSAPHPHYRHPYGYPHGPMGYSPMGHYPYPHYPPHPGHHMQHMAIIPPANAAKTPGPATKDTTSKSSEKSTKSAPAATPALVTMITPATPKGSRTAVDPPGMSSAKKKRKVEEEATFSFATNKKLTTSTALYIIGFLDSSERKKAATVCKDWNALLKDKPVSA